MCGIVGFQGGFAPNLLDGMSRCVRHRGPDASGRFLNEPWAPAAVGFAHRRLAIIDLSPEGNQPLSVLCEQCGALRKGELTLVYNGEIYNFRELRAELLKDGHRFKSGSDSEVLLHLYGRHGLEMLNRLNGIFAFAIYDGRSRGRPETVEQGDVFLARDQLGVKPLYYGVSKEGVLFASELKAIAQSGALSREVDHVALHQHLAYLWTPAPRTMLKGVKKLEPGHAMILRKSRIDRKWAYYDLPYGRLPHSGSRSEIASELRTKIEQAVKRQLISDVPIGAFLSGGLDSSSVVAMMRDGKSGPRPICYTIAFDGAELDGSPSDLPYARRTAEYLDVELRIIEVGTDSIRHLDRMLYALDEPQADPAPINALLIAEQARGAGIKVLLSGAGGDDIFSGYRRHVALRSEHFWARLPRSARGVIAAAARRSASGQGTGRGGTLYRRIVKLFEHADLEPDERAIAYFWWSGEAMRRSLYSPAFSEAVREEDTASPLMASLGRIPHELDPLNRMLYLDTKHFLADHNLNYTDKTGMAAGVEVRVPLLDIDLVEYAARIPASLKQRGPTGKYIFRKAMEGLLPTEVIHRKKTGFGAPLRRWLRHELRDRVDDTLSPRAINNRGLFSADAVRRLVALDRTGRVDGSYTIFALMCFEIWCRIFIDGAASVEGT